MVVVVAVMKGVAPRTLQELCIEHLCINLEELLQVPRVLEFLEPKHRAILYYAAKRRGLLTNNLLRSFVNESDCWSSLNVSRTSVTESTLRDVLPLLPRLKCIDVSYCEHVTSSIFQQLVLFCPNLESISCSGLRVTKKEQLMQLRRMMPTIELDSCSLDSWEEMEEQAPWEGKLLQLRQLIWENIPIELYKWIQTHVRPGAMQCDAMLPSDSLLTSFQIHTGVLSVILFLTRVLFSLLFGKRHQE